jgi:hypothetical protein
MLIKKTLKIDSGNWSEVVTQIKDFYVHFGLCQILNSFKHIDAYNLEFRVSLVKRTFLLRIFLIVRYT